MHKEREKAEAWLRRAMRAAPRPLPAGRFPQLVQQTIHAGLERSLVYEVLDEWLNYGYCEIIDPVTDDIRILPAGEVYFGGLVREDDAKKKPA